MIRPRGGTTRRGDDRRGQRNTSAVEIGRLLREARERRGLDLLAAHDRLDRPMTQLEALEAGDLAALPDQAVAISTLRRYATFLGLDGDSLALQLIDGWAAVTEGRPPLERRGRAAASDVTGVMAAVTTGPEHLRAFTQTGKVPKVRGLSTAASGAAGPGFQTGPPTGTFPVVPRRDLRRQRRAVARARRRERAPTSLKAVTWTAVALLVVVAAGAVLLHVRPTWLARAHILRTVGPTTTTAGGPGPTTTAPARLTVVAGPATPTSAAYTVTSPTYQVAVAVTRPCWVEISATGSPTPLVVGVQAPGKVLTFPVHGPLTVRLGSTGALVTVRVGTTLGLFTAPKAAPFTYSFTPTPAT